MSSVAHATMVSEIGQEIVNNSVSRICAQSGHRGVTLYLRATVIDAVGLKSRRSVVSSDVVTPSKTDVTRLIREAILTGEFVPQQRLVEADLSERFAVSRAAARAALLTLTSEGLVERLPNRGARVRAISVDEAVEIAEARLALEPLTARKAAERLTDEDAADLARLRARISDALEGGDLLLYSSMNRELDANVQRISGHRTAAEILERLHAQSARHQFRLGFAPGRAKISGPEHLEIIDAILARDPERAESATRRHLEGVLTILREMD